MSVPYRWRHIATGCDNMDEELKYTCTQNVVETGRGMWRRRWKARESVIYKCKIAAWIGTSDQRDHNRWWWWHSRMYIT